jgi:hypothetical protein
MKARERRSVQSPRTRFARALVPRAFSRFFGISCRRFEISIRRPEAHFARRSGAERFASHGPIGMLLS